MPDLAIEIDCGAPAVLICGVDEAGRGPLAGPVTAAAVILPAEGLPEELVRAIDDSKRVKPENRPVLADEIRARCVTAVASASVEEIDRLNILQATFLAMRRAVAALVPVPALALVDGNQVPGDLGCRARCVIGGDGLSLSIAAASILAKVDRDAAMRRLAVDFPGYGWETNFGYATPAHARGLADLGPTVHHRRSFAPITQLGLDLTPGAETDPVR
ncbi:MAG: ribonuclease HII [Alphaproteobacteria bacterium]|jgi:ribonuclease HII|nr:ribonuclease HII [Alphaproteobacteria bacterium]